MDIKKGLEKIAKDFDLENHVKLKYVEFSPRQMIIRSMIGNDPTYENYKKKYHGDLTKAILDYLNSENYKKDIMMPQACVISKHELPRDLKLVSKIYDSKLKKELENIYSKIKNNMAGKKRLTLVWKNKPKISPDYVRDEIILHEFVHELLEENKIRPKSWKWNEGLVTYVTHRQVGQLKRIVEDEESQDTLWYTYQTYARKWMKILGGTKSPEERKKLILRKLKVLNKNN